MAKKAAKKTTTSNKKPKPESKAVKSSEVRPAISQSKLKSLIASARSAQSNINEISGGLGSEIKTAVEKNHLHRKAFRVVLGADRMEPEKLADFLDCLDHYFDISGLRDRAAQVARMQFGPGGEAQPVGDEGDEGQGEDDDNVHDFPGARGVAAE